jgi:hypothetical protein
MRRWRVIVTLKDQPNISVKRHINKDCKLCVVRMTHGMAVKLSTAFEIPMKDIAWQVMIYKGHLNSWDIVWTEKTPMTREVKRHAHW